MTLDPKLYNLLWYNDLQLLQYSPYWFRHVCQKKIYTYHQIRSLNWFQRLSPQKHVTNKKSVPIRPSNPLFLCCICLVLASVGGWCKKEQNYLQNWKFFHNVLQIISKCRKLQFFWGAIIRVHIQPIKIVVFCRIFIFVFPKKTGFFPFR